MTKLTLLTLFAILTRSFAVFSKIFVEETRVASPTRGDVGMIFYVLLRNSDPEPYRLYTRMLECCEEMTPHEKDCNFMYLLGGDMGIVEANKTKNITLIYPNLYIHNRIGKCRVSIVYLNQQGRTYEIQTTISFNTTLIAPARRGKDSFCRSKDQDNLENCEPINCQTKYLGEKNFYNHFTNRCEQVKSCIADSNKDMPDIVYVPISNRCRNLEHAVGFVDLQHLIGSKNEKDLNFRSNLRCHHGKLDNRIGLCVCDPGWISVPFDGIPFAPSLDIRHMCNVQVGTWNLVYRDRINTTLLIIGLFAVFVTMAILILSFILHIIFRVLEKKRVVR